jgi:hypothetical protein
MTTFSIGRHGGPPAPLVEGSTYPARFGGESLQFLVRAQQADTAACPPYPPRGQAGDPKRGRQLDALTESP